MEETKVDIPTVENTVPTTNTLEETTQIQTENKDDHNEINQNISTVQLPESQPPKEIKDDFLHHIHTPIPKERDKDTINPEPHSCLKIFKTGGYLGNYILLWGDIKKHDYFPLIAVLGVDWPVTIITYTLFILVMGFDYNLLKTYFNNPFALTIAIIIFVLIFVSLLLTTLSNPGIIFRNDYAQYTKDKASVCYICEVDRPKKAVHCARCNVCCLEMDHHCPWMGKCIAKNNFKFFSIAVGSLFCLLFASCLIVVIGDAINFK